MLPVIRRPLTLGAPADQTGYLASRATLFKVHAPLQPRFKQLRDRKSSDPPTSGVSAALLPGRRPEALGPGGEGGYRPMPKGTQAENVGS
jgi:hypothetical protein